MPTFHDFVLGPWRAVPVLGVTQILAWGAIFYPPVLTLPLIAADRGWSITFAMGGFSLALLVAGLVSPLVGRLIDRHGGHRIMPVGSLLAALGLLGLAHAEHRASYLAVWALLGVATAASLYDPAFATLGRIFGAAARAPITALTLAGGFASTVSWPTTHLLIDRLGVRGTYLVYALLLALVAAPLHAFALPRQRADRDARPGARRPRPRQCCRRGDGRSRWSLRHSPPMHSCHRASRRICLRSSAAPASMREASSPSARCSARRRFWRASGSSSLRAQCTRCWWRALRSACCSRASR